MTDIDVKATLKAKLNVGGRPYRILGACNPALAHRVIAAVPDVGLLLPCHLVVREKADGKIDVALLASCVMAKVKDNPEVLALPIAARERLVRMWNAIAREQR